MYFVQTIIAYIVCRERALQHILVRIFFSPIQFRFIFEGDISNRNWKCITDRRSTYYCCLHQYLLAQAVVVTKACSNFLTQVENNLIIRVFSMSYWMAFFSSHSASLWKKSWCVALRMWYRCDVYLIDQGPLTPHDLCIYACSFRLWKLINAFYAISRAW